MSTDKAAGSLDQSNGREDVTVSVIIPTHERPESLRKVLEALARQSFPFEEFEVVVVIDGPHAETERLLGELNAPYRLRWFVQPAKGACSARNLGVREAHGSILAFLDDDIIPVKDFLSRHIASHANESIVLLGGLKLSPDSPSPIAAAVDWCQSHFDRCSQIGYVPIPSDLPDGNFSASRENILQAGAWHESITGFGGDDDRDLALRLKSLGLPLRFDPEALGYHYQTKSWEHYLRDRRQAGRANQLLMLKCPDLFRDEGFQHLRELHADRWRAATYRIVKHTPEFIFSLLLRGADPMGSVLKQCGARRLLSVAVRGLGLIFYYRGLADPPGVAERVLAELWGP